MRVFENLNPQDVFYYFEEICRIPHGSGNIKQISDYLVGFAKEHGLEHYQDETGNVIIIKEASEGYEDHEPVMLQGHMDMVAVKTPESDIDMTREGLRIQTDGERVYAKGTSLGGDDGIAVAYGLALLAGNYAHPRLELVITVDEEVGMDGARAIDLSMCKAHTMINLDSEEEGYFLAGCAGGARVNYHHQVKEKREKGIYAVLKVTGLLGGHSGEEIDKGRANANLLLTRALMGFDEAGISFCIKSLEGGLADNAIPRQAEAVLLLEQGTEKAEQVIKNLEEVLREELANTDPGVTLTLEIGKEEELEVLDTESSRKISKFLNEVPYGVLAMSASLKGLVETSLNPGIVTFLDGELHVGISVRSSVAESKAALIDRLVRHGDQAGISSEITGDYPGWEFNSSSPLRDKMIQVYRKMYQKEPVVRAIHAGLECGLFAEKIPALDCVSIGPDMKNIHTTEEELSVSSTERVWKYLVELLKEL